MLPDSFTSTTKLSPSSGMEGIHRNIAAIRATPTPPSAGSSLGRASALSQVRGGGLLSKFAVQASGELIFLIVASHSWFTGGV